MQARCHRVDAGFPIHLAWQELGVCWPVRMVLKLALQQKLKKGIDISATEKQEHRQMACVQPAVAAQQPLAKRALTIKAHIRLEGEDER